MLNLLGLSMVVIGSTMIVMSLLFTIEYMTGKLVLKNQKLQENFLWVLFLVMLSGNLLGNYGSLLTLSHLNAVPWLKAFLKVVNLI